MIFRFHEHILLRWMEVYYWFNFKIRTLTLVGACLVLNINPAIRDTIIECTESGVTCKFSLQDERSLANWIIDTINTKVSGEACLLPIRMHLMFWKLPHSNYSCRHVTRVMMVHHAMEDYGVRVSKISRTFMIADSAHVEEVYHIIHVQSQISLCTAFYVSMAFMTRLEQQSIKTTAQSWSPRRKQRTLYKAYRWYQPWNPFWTNGQVVATQIRLPASSCVFNHGFFQLLAASTAWIPYVGLFYTCYRVHDTYIHRR